MLHDADRESADNVDRSDDHAGDGLAPHEPAGTVHGGEEVGMPLDLEACRPGLLARQGPGLNLGIDRHLPPRQTVEGEAGRDLAGARRSGCDDDELDDRDDREDHPPDDEIVGCDKLSERFHDLAGGIGTVEGRPRQHQSRGRHVEDEADERRAEEKRRENAQFQRRAGGDRPQEGEHRKRQIGGEEDIEEGRRDRRQHHHHGQKDPDRHDPVEGVPARRGGEGGAGHDGFSRKGRGQ